MFHRGTPRLALLPLTLLAVGALGSGIALAVGDAASGFYASGIAMLLLALPRDEPREYHLESESYGLREAVATFVTLLLGILSIALGVFIQLH